MEDYKNIIMLPTEGSLDRNKAPIFKDTLDNGRLAFNPQPTNISYNDCKYYHLYEISDEDIKVGDWVYFESERESGIIQCEFIKDNRINGDFMNIKGHGSYGSRKIIATSFQYLTNLIIQGESDYFNYDDGKKLNTNKLIKKIPESFIQEFIKAYNNGETNN